MNFSKYINNISSLQFFQLFRFGILFLISIIFTKTHLGIADIGIYETLLFISGVLSFFWLQGLIQSFLPLYKSRNKLDNKKSPDIFNAFLLTLFFSTAAFIFVLGFKNYIVNYTGNTGITPYLNLFAFYILLSGPASLIEYIYLLRDKPGMIICYGVISFTAQLIFVALPVVFGKSLEWSIYGLVIISMIRVIWLFLLIHKYSVFQISFSFIKDHFSLGYPLILGALLSGSAQYIDDFLVSHFFDSANFAIYRYGAKQFPLVVLLANAFSNAMVPVFASGELQSAMKQVKVRSARLMHILFPVTIILLLTSKWLYPVVFNVHFLPSANIFNILLLLIISYMIFPQTILIGLKKTKLILIASTLELILHIILSLVLLHYFEIAGIAVATVCAYVFEKILLMVFAWGFLKISPVRFIPLRQYLIYTFILFSTFLIVTFLF